jgi:hypothetical protein
MQKILLAVAVLAVVFSAASLGSAPYVPQTGAVDADETVTTVKVDEDGDAVFSLELRTRLDTQEKRQAFENFSSSVEADPDAAVAGFRDSVRVLVARADNRTGRDMSVSDFSVETRSEPLPVDRGIVVYKFDWSGFASTDGGVRIGDVLSGYILGESDSLVVRYPDGYAADSVSPTPDSSDGEVVWNGPRDFDEDEPRVVVLPGGEDAGPSDNGTVPSPDTVEAGDAPPYIYAVVFVLLLTALAAFLFYRRRQSGAAESDTGTSRENGDAETGFGESSGFEDLPDGRRVLRIIESEDGRMKQKGLVYRTGWSEAKVSQVTSRLEEDGEITKLRMGRENIIELIDEEDAT